MLYKAALLLWLASAAAAHALQPAPMPCDVSPATIKQQKEWQWFAEQASTLDASAYAEDIVVDTYVHVVAKDKTEAGGYVTQAVIDKQMQVIADDFKGTGFKFVLKDVDWTVNANWAADNDQAGMKRKLRKGKYTALNLYYMGAFPRNKSGYCYYPTRATEGSSAFYTDGCTQGSWTLPGMSDTPFSTGRVTTHEIGHWSNLIHTFEGGCSGGDQVDDTPAEASAPTGCPEERDTCPAAGVDPIHNHMDYTYDACRTEFTPGQIKRMKDAWVTYRQGK